MKNIFLIISIILAGTTLSLAQGGRGLARIHAAKLAYITDRLHLSYHQAERFTPVYKDYQKEVRALRQSFFSKYRNTRPDETNDATSRQWIDDNLDYQQQVSVVNSNYNFECLTTTSPQQLSNLYKAEREFNEMLVQRLRQQRGGPHFKRMNR